MDLGLLKDIATIVATTVGAIAAVSAILVYFTNSRLRRAEWLASLYEKFYERSDLKEIRETLDCEVGDSPGIVKLISEESAEFADYLNFFEFVAVLQKSRQLKKTEIEDLFRYYLDRLENCHLVRSYIANNGYEQLDRLLRERAKAK
jgi:hypothetical protein